MKVQVAFDLSANGVGNYFTLNDSTRGVLDGATYVLAGDVLVDLTSRVRSVQVKRGRNRQLGRFTAGAANVTFDNRDRYLDPTYLATIGTRTNLVTNPSFELDTTGWEIVGTGSILLSSTSQFGSKSAQLTLTSVNNGNGISTSDGYRFPITAGSTYTVSVYVLLDSSSAAVSSLDIDWREFSEQSGGTELLASDGTNTGISSSAWTRLSRTVTAVNNAWGDITIGFGASQAAGTRIIYFDAVLVEQSSTLQPYFDGTNEDGSIRMVTQGWNGTANASTSTITYYVPGTGSPYSGSIVPGKRVEIEHAGFPMYAGNVADWNLSYDIGGDSTAEASCTDGLASIANQVVTAGTATAQLTGARIGAYLTDVGWSTTARAISAGQATLGADVIGQNENAMTYLSAAVDSDPGALFVGKTGLMTFRDRNDLQSFTSGATFGPSAIPFIGVQVQYGAETLYPTVIVNYWGGTAVAQVTATDATAASLYGNADLTVDTLLGSNTDASLLANYLVGRYANPLFRVQSLTVALHGITSDQVTTVLGLELGDMILLDGWTPNGVGSAITQYLTIEGIEHQADPATHFVTFTLSQAQASFQLDSAIFGVLDEDRIGF
jgi:hypothetical protein